MKNHPTGSSNREKFLQNEHPSKHLKLASHSLHRRGYLAAVATVGRTARTALAKRLVGLFGRSPGLDEKADDPGFPKMQGGQYFYEAFFLAL